MRKLAIMLGVISMMLGCREPYTAVPIAQKATLSKDWAEFRPAQPIRWSQPDGEIDFHIDSTHERSDQLEIIFPNGERCVPEVELIADNGRKFVIDTHGWMNEDMDYSISNQPSHFTIIQTIRIRSSLPLQISNLRWEGFDFSKVKR